MHIHLAILYKEYINKILNREKTIESRFSKIKCQPFGIVKGGDLIFLKESSGPILGKAVVDKVLFYSQLDFVKIKNIVNQYNYGICMESSFLQRISGAKYGTLIFLRDITRIKPIYLTKKNRLSWIVLDFLKDSKFKNNLFQGLMPHIYPNPSGFFCTQNDNS
jgi:hypothetical protein